MGPDMLTILYTYYGQQERIAGILAEKHPETRVIIIDDCSPDPLGPLPGIDVYRIEIDIPWNQPGARNLGFKLAEGWVVCADIDHLVTRQNIDDILALPPELGTMYLLGRETTDSTNVYLIHKDDFEKAGGYDEDFCGHYGYDDILFLESCKRNLKVVGHREIKVKDFSQESHVKNLDRALLYNQLAFYKNSGPGPNNKPRIRFKWHKV
jgi:hypothetical protein